MSAAKWFSELWAQRGGTVACALLLAIPFAIVIWTGNLSAAPRFIDDNQIFTLDRQLEDEGLLWVIGDHFGERLFEMKRMVPVYLAHKLFEVWVFGTNLTAWTLYTALVGGLTACVLFWFGRLMKLTVFEAFCFSLIVVLGPQSVLWWRYLHGEGIGMLLTALALVCIPLSLGGDGRERTFRTLFVVFAILASFCKESFVLLLPALVFALLVEYWRVHGTSIAQTLRRNVGIIVVLAVVCVLEILTIRVFLGRTYFYYTGWSGFDLGRLSATTFEFFTWSRSWILLAVLIAAGTAYGLRREKAGRDPKLDPVLAVGLALLVLTGAIVVPQFLLYMSSGFSGLESINFSRYLVPSTLAVAVLAVFPLQWIRKTESAGERARLVRSMRLACGAALCVYLVLRFVSAVEAAHKFAEATDDIGGYLDAIAYHTDDEDFVIVVSGKHNLHDNIRRTAVLLTEYAGLENVKYLPVTGGEALDSFVWSWSEENLYTRAIEGSTIYAIGDALPSAVLIPFDDFVPLEVPFLLQWAEWFDPSDHVRFANAHGDVAYFRVGNLPGRLEAYENLRVTLGVSGVVSDGVLRVSGFARSPEFIERLVLVVDGSVVESTVALEHRAMPHPELPDYPLDYVDFVSEAPWGDDGRPGTVAIELYSGEKLLAREEVAFN